MATLQEIMDQQRALTNMHKLTVGKINQIEAHSGSTMSEETRKKMSESHKNISEETRMKLRNASLGKVLSDEHKAKLIAASTNREISEETRQKMSKARKGVPTGKIMSDSEKQKLREAKSKYMYVTPTGTYTRQELTDAYLNVYKIKTMIYWCDRNMNGFSKVLKSET